MRTVKIIFVAGGETFTAHVQVRAEYLETAHGRIRLKNLLETNMTVRILEEL
jgi:hypothetical protein